MESEELRARLENIESKLNFLLSNLIVDGEDEVKEEEPIEKEVEEAKENPLSENSFDKLASKKEERKPKITIKPKENI